METSKLNLEHDLYCSNTPVVKFFYWISLHYQFAHKLYNMPMNSLDLFGRADLMNKVKDSMTMACKLGNEIVNGNVSFDDMTIDELIESAMLAARISNKKYQELCGEISYLRGSNNSDIPFEKLQSVVNGWIKIMVKNPKEFIKSMDAMNKEYEIDCLCISRIVAKAKAKAQEVNTNKDINVKKSKSCPNFFR